MDIIKKGHGHLDGFVCESNESNFHHTKFDEEGVQQLKFDLKKRMKMPKAKSLLGKKKKNIWKIIDECNWDQLLSFLETSAGKIAALKVDFSGLTPLAYALTYYPPIEVVDALIDICPDVLGLKDVHGQYPLHVACFSGVSTDVVSLVISRYPKAIHLRDNHGRYPLHHAVEFACSEKINSWYLPSGTPPAHAKDHTLTESEKEKAISSSIDNVMLLSLEAPQLVHAADKDKGITPMKLCDDYNSSASTSVCNVLEYVYTKYCIKHEENLEEDDIEFSRDDFNLPPLQLPKVIVFTQQR